MTRLLPFLLLLLSAGGCATAPAEPSGDLAAEVAEFHGVDAWRGKKAVRTKIHLVFGDKLNLKGELLYAPHANKVRLELEDGTLLVFDGERAWMKPEFPRARFHLLTWPYFLAAPFKLGDPGTRLEEVGQHVLFPGTAPQRVAHLTFGVGIGDTPDDWYDVYVSPEGRLNALGYIVTYGKDMAAAEKAPHACVYDSFHEHEGVLLALSYRFYDWNREEGVTGGPIGLVDLMNLRYVTPKAGEFTKPPGAVEAPLPR